MKRERWGWVLVWTAGVFAGVFESELVELVGEGRAAGLYGLVGIFLGWAWYRMNPRAFGERMLPAALVTGFACLLAVAAGGELSTLKPKGVMLIGGLAGLVLTEQWRPGASWRHQQRTPLSSRDTMRELH